MYFQWETFEPCGGSKQTGPFPLFSTFCVHVRAQRTIEKDRSVCCHRAAQKSPIGDLYKYNVHKDPTRKQAVKLFFSLGVWACARRPQQHMCKNLRHQNAHYNRESFDILKNHKKSTVSNIASIFTFACRGRVGFQHFSLALQLA